MQIWKQKRRVVTHCPGCCAPISNKQTGCFCAKNDHGTKRAYTECRPAIAEKHQTGILDPWLCLPAVRPKFVKPSRHLGDCMKRM